MKIKETYDIIIEKHPHYESLNKKLLQDADSIDYPLSHKTNVMAKCSDWRVETENTLKIEKWILQVLYREKPYLNRFRKDPFTHIRNGDLFFVRYNKGHHAVSHDHIPAIWSWSYYVKCPAGSSPLVFTTSGKKANLKEGQCIVFPSSVKHHVPKNNCDDRVVLVGNIECSLKMDCPKGFLT